MFLKAIEPPASLAGRKVTVMGLGLFGGGEGATRFLCRHGAIVTVTDKRSRDVLEPTIAELKDVPVRWVLGEHREEDFTGADLVIPSPAVPRDAPLLELCRRRGIPLDTEMNLFFKHCAGRICAVTGSNGKTTTTTLVGAMASRRWPRTLVGGNLGRSLLPDVESIADGEWVVLEVSSFQLEDLASIERRPEISLVTNLSPNHLDRHRTYEAYVAAKREILRSSGPADTAVLNGEDALVRSWGGARRKTFYFGRANRVLPAASGVWIGADDAPVFLRDGGAEVPLFEARDLALPGRFNLLNAAGAAAAAWAMGVDGRSIREAVHSFRAVEHRLEPVVEHEGVRYLNDSIATTPESTMAALEALGPNAVVICGGSSKGCSFRALGHAIGRRARGAVLLGQTAEAIREHIPRRRGGPEVRMATSLEDAVMHARDIARPGDRVILSPACPSYDMFVNFVERGRRFKDIARRLASQGPGR
jgi:UDP-N-acetylmuramoylalanine--D-glutamate ligase